MSLKRIDLFAPLANQYGVVSYFTEELARALQQQGVQTRVLHADRHDPKSFLSQLFDDPPDCTLSFNGLLPDPEGRFLCDLIQIPHVAYLTDAPNHFFPLVQSTYNIITCIDQNFYQTFKRFQFPNLLFVPHAISKDLELTRQKPVYDILMLNSFIDYEEIGQRWSEKYGPNMAAILEEAAERTLNDTDTSYLEAFVQTMDQFIKKGKSINPREFNYEAVLDDLESYVGGKSRIELLQSIEERPIHIFGSDWNTGKWKKYFKNHSHIHIHDPVPFVEAIELIKQAKILLHAGPEIKRGLHKRVLSGLACGAAVLALKTSFLQEAFQDGKEILLYSPRSWKEVNEKLHLYLHDEEERQKLVSRGREKVMKEHTWDQRAQSLIEELPPILERIQS